MTERVFLKFVAGDKEIVSIYHGTSHTKEVDLHYVETPNCCSLSVFKHQKSEAFVESFIGSNQLEALTLAENKYNIEFRLH